MTYHEIALLVRMAILPAIEKIASDYVVDVISIPPQVTSKVQWFRVHIAKRSLANDEFYAVPFAIVDTALHHSLENSQDYLKNVRAEVVLDVKQALEGAPYHGCDTWTIDSTKWLNLAGKS